MKTSDAGFGLSGAGKVGHIQKNVVSVPRLSQEKGSGRIFFLYMPGQSYFFFDSVQRVISFDSIQRPFIPNRNIAFV